MTSETPLDRLRPLLRTLLPALLYAAGMEMVIGRLVAPRSGLFSLPGRHPSKLWGTLLAQIDVTLFHFALLMAVLVVILLGLASLSRAPRVPADPWIGPGLILVGVWSLARFALDTPASSLAFQLVSLALALGILFSLSAATGTASARAFAVLAAAALGCGAFVVVSRILQQMGGAPLAWEPAVRQGSEILALACGALAPALVPWDGKDARGREDFPPALLAALPAAAFLLLFHRGDPGGAVPHRWSFGWSWDLPLPEELLGLLYAGVLFVFFFALFRALWEPRWRLRGYGLAFLFLAGLHHSLSYQHLLALMGLILFIDGEEQPAAAVQPPAC
jgi:hypothetical protein